MNRRPPRADCTTFYTRSFDGVELFGTLIATNPEKVVVVAHPAVVGSFYGQVTDLALELSGSFSVALFDFRGHGRSGGRCPLGFDKVSRDLEAVVERMRKMGFKKVGVAGFSLGAAAAMVLASRNPCFDALVSIGCPPRFPDVGLLDYRASRAVLRLLGMRVDRSRDSGPDPIDVAGRLPRINKLLIFGEWEVCTPEEVSAFTVRVSGPKRYLTVPGAWHAELKGREPLVRNWFRENL